jgi:hypothetical protein
MTIVDKVEIFHREGKPEEKTFYDGYPEAAKWVLTKLTDEQRLELFHNYCLSCGSNNPKCQCWNDE